MAGRRKQNVDAFGKSWSPIDIPNLEKAVKLYERLNYLNDHFASSLSSSKAIMQQINEQTDIKNELQEMGIKLTEDEAKQVLELFKNRQKETEQISKTNKAISSKDSVFRRAGMSQTNTSMSWGNAGSSIMGAIQKSYAQNQLNKNFEYFKQNSISKNSATISKLAENKTVNDIKGSAGKFNTAASVLQVAVDVFKKGVDIFYEGVKQGFMKQTSTYESTFSNIAVRTGASRDKYLNAQWDTNNTLSSLGLRDNVSTSEVQTMWDKLASAGVKTSTDERQMYANAIDDIVTQKIVPYLDTSSQLWQQLNINLGPTFGKQMRGITSATLSVADNSFSTEKIVSEMLPMVQYMGEQYKDEAAKAIAESSGFAAKLRDKGISQEVIDSLTSNYNTLFTSPQKVLSEGTAAEKDAYALLLKLGLNPRNPEDAAEIYEVLTSINKKWADIAPDPNSSLLNGTIAGIVSENTGVGNGNINYISSYQGLSYGDISEAKVAGNEAGRLVNSEGEKNTDKLAAGDYQTEQQQRDTWLENASNELSVLKEKFPTWFDLVVTAIKGVGAILTTGLIAKGIGALSGLGGGGAALSASKGLGALLGAAGPIGAGIAAVGVTTLAIKAYTDKKSKETLEKASSAKTNLEQQLIDEGVSANIAGVKSTAEYEKIADGKNGWAADEFQYNSEGWGAHNLTDETAQKYGIDKHWYWNRETEINKAFEKHGQTRDWAKYNALKLATFKSVWGNEKEIAASAAGLMIAAIESGNAQNKWITDAIAQEYGISDISPESVAELLSAYEITKASDITDMTDKMLNKDIWLNTGASDGNGWMNPSVSEDILKSKYNLHRLGLNDVPYDDYPAILHENEAVLSASTANELRNLITEYRETSKQSYQFDAIIQQQTTTLVTELQAIRDAILGNNTTPVTNTLDTNSNLRNMKYVRSTGSFQ